MAFLRIFYFSSFRLVNTGLIGLFKLIVLKIIAVAGLLLVGGCSVISYQHKVTDEAIEPVERVKEPVVDKPVVDEEMNTAIDPDVLYTLLVAELAGQRKQYDIALEGYLRAAKRVDDVRLPERAAKIALFLKDKRKTQEAIALWLQQEPDNLEVRKVALLSALRGEDKSSAVTHMDYLLAADPAGFENMVLELVKIMRSEGRAGFFDDVLNDLSARHPEQASIPFAQAVLAAQMGKNLVAREKVEKSLALQPDWSKALLFKAQLAAVSQTPEQARKEIEAAIAKDPENKQLKKLLANVLIKSDQLEQAVHVFEAILQDNPQDQETQYALALVYLQLKQYGKAGALFKQLLASPRYQMPSNLYLGRIEVEEGNFDKGLVWFDRVTSGPLKFEALAASVSALIDAKRYDQALARLQEGRDDMPEHAARFLLMEAEVYNAKKQYQKAFDLLSKGLLDNPGQKELLYTRALVAERLGRLDVLETDLQAILQQHPDNANALNALGYTLADRTSRLDEAEKYLQRALELEPNEPVIIDSYGWLLFRQGKLEQALEYLQRAYKKIDRGEVAAHLVEVLWVLGKKNEARKVFEQALPNSTDSESFQALKKRFPEL